MRYCLKAICLIALLLIMVLPGGPVQAEELVIAAHYTDRGSFTRHSYHVERTMNLVEEVCKRLDIQFRYVEYPFARALEEARKGNVHCIMNVFRTPEREEFLYFPDEEHLFTEMVVFWQRDAKMKPKNLQELQGKKVGAVRGFFYGDGVLETLEPNVVYVKDANLLYAMLLEGRFEYALGNRSTGERFIFEQGKLCNLETGFLLTRKARNIVFSKTMGLRGKELANMFASEIGKILDERFDF